MHCNKCNNSWNSDRPFLFCPFCGAGLDQDDGDMPNIHDNSRDALACIMRKHGVDVLLGDKMKSYFNDYAPGVEERRKNVIFIVQQKAADILKKKMEASDVERENAFRQAVQRVIDTYGIERSLVESVVREFTDALGWKINIAAVTGQTQESTQKSSASSAATYNAQLVAVNTRYVNTQYVDTRNANTSALQVGQRNVKFGRYNWRVLDVKNGKALLLAEDIIGERRCYFGCANITWEEWKLRGYLNGEFLKTFSGAEQIRIALTTVQNENNQWFGTKGGRDTTDRIFLLSIEEVVRYFGDSGQLRNRPEKAARYIDDQYNDERVAKYNGEAAWWWLRSPGSDGHEAVRVDDNGAVDIAGYHVICEYGGVRPALWINL